MVVLKAILLLEYNNGGRDEKSLYMDGPPGENQNRYERLFKYLVFYFDHEIIFPASL